MKYIPHTFSLQGLISIFKNSNIPPFFKTIVLDTNSEGVYSLFFIDTNYNSIDGNNYLYIPLIKNEIETINDLDVFVEDEIVLNKNKHPRLRTKSPISNREDFLKYLQDARDLISDNYLIEDSKNDDDNSYSLPLVDVFFRYQDIDFRIDGSFLFKTYQVLLISKIEEEPSTLKDVEAFISKSACIHSLINYEYMSHLLTLIQSYSYPV